MASQLTPRPDAKEKIVASPVSIVERIQSVDILRGFAILGILLVNMSFFNSPQLWQQIYGRPQVDQGIDLVARWIVNFLATSKFYPLFSFLFGFGLSIQVSRAQARGRSVVPLFLRRQMALMFFGLAHALLLWNGDILFPYALLGFVLILFRNAKPRTLLIWVVVLLLIPLLLSIGSVLLTASFASMAGSDSMMLSPGMVPFFPSIAEAIRVYSQGSYGDIFNLRLLEWVLMMVATSFFMFFHILAMFLLGLYAGKRGFFQNTGEHVPFLRNVLRWGLIIGLPCNVFYATALAAGGGGGSQGYLLSAAAQAVVLVGGPAQTLAYIAGGLLLLQKQPWQRRLAPLAAVGRMALSNYLFQTIVCTTIFYSYGLGLYGQVGAAAGLLLSLLIYAIQVPLSNLWLRHFRFGPFEWLWRTLTYLKAQPMRYSSSAPISPQVNP
ncbi:MAG: DUF418 domain-containing protein [Chloroflexi bacterium]|nr:DUF418 domain-containing protein [Chloroflexota bacterium]